MAQPLILVVLIVLASIGSIGYVYAYRGTVRYQSFSEYLRKGWPLFSPLNCFLYIFTQKRAAKPIMDLQDFKELDVIKDNYEVILEEAKELLKQNIYEDISGPESSAHYDIGFRTFYKYGWRKFYLKWYGYQHASARKYCPKTTELLSKIPTVNGAMFTILPPGGKLTRHCDPMACSLRYHLGLMTPNSDECFISVDNQTYSWRDGEALLFDETYIHYVRNDTEHERLILMCDIERPLHLFGWLFNIPYKFLMRAFVVPNTPEDKAGMLSRLFQLIAPIMAKGQELKKTNRTRYKLYTRTLNYFLILVLFGIIYLLFSLVMAIF